VTIVEIDEETYEEVSIKDFFLLLENNIRRLSFKHAYCEGLLNRVQSLIQ